MTTKGFARSIATTKPKAFEKIMNFFKDAINYKNDGYSKAARKYYKEYKAMYEAFSAVNKGNNALEGAEGGKRYSFASVAHTFFNGNAYMNSSFTITPKGGIIIETAKGRKKVKYIPKNFFRGDVLYSLQRQLDFIFADAEDAIASELGIEYKNAVVIVDSQKSEGQVTYQVREILEIEDDEARKIILKGHNYESKQRGNFSDQISSSLGDELLDNRQSDIQREFGENTENNIGKSPNNQDGISEEDRDRIELEKIYDDIVYFDAINRNDMETAQKIIDKASRRSLGNASGAEINIYIKDGHKKDGSVIDFANAILDGRKKGETRTHKSLSRKWVGIAKNGKVIGRVRFGEPIVLRKGTQEYYDSLIEGTEYDIADGETKYYYPVEEVMDLRDNPRIIVRNGNYGQYQYKSTDTITHDDNGNIIPPSERFNLKNPDIRYSLDIDSIMEQTRSKVHAEPADAQKPKLKESISTAWTGLQISLTNEHSFFPSVINMLESKKISINS